MKFFSLAVLFCFFLNFSIGNSVSIRCYYSMQSWYETNGEKYTCMVINDEVFNGDRVTIEKAEGNHESGKINDDVKFFYISSVNLKYFPRNLENVFKNLELIFLFKSSLIEITRVDLKPFPKLKHFQLAANPIEVIREDLFIHNPELEVFVLFGNKISHIDPKALSHLNNLRAVYFFDNVCEFSNHGAETRSGVLEIVKQIEQGQCQNPKYTTTTENPLILQINQLKQQIEEQQEEISKLKNESIEKEQNNKKLTEENKKYQKIIDKQEKQLKEQKTQNQNLTKNNQETKSNLKVFEAKNEEMKQNIEKILKISEKYFEKFESQSSDLTNFYSKCNNDKFLEKSDKIIEKLENC